MTPGADPLFVAIDASTTAVKALVFAADGRPVAESRVALDLRNPEPDAWEQDAESWWTATLQTLAEAVAQLDDASTVAALCVTHQRETFVIADGDSAPIRPALVWMDARCRLEVADAIRRLGADRLHEISGKPPCTTPSLYKLMYVLGREPALRAREFMVLDVHALVVWRLTGRAATSLASADPLGLVDMRARDWSEELLALPGIARSQLPELVEPGAQLGALLPEVAARTGLPAGLPVIAGAGDGQAAGLGAGILGPGRAYLNLGTAIVSGVLSREYVVDRAFRTMMGGAPGTYFLESDLKGGTFTLDWLVDKWLGGDRTALGRLEGQASHLTPGSDGLVLVPYWNGVMDPYWNDDATGIVMGLHGAHGPAHLYRAILEGIALEQRLHATAIERATGERIEELVVMGGGSRSDLWCGIIASVTGRRVTRAGSPEATALGAALLAATGAGAFADLDVAARAMTRTGQSFDPGPDAPIYDALYRSVYDKLYESVAPRLDALAAIRRRAHGTRGS